MAKVVSGFSGFLHHIGEDLRIVREYVRLNPERRFFADKNDVTAPEEEFVVLWFAELRCGWIRSVRFAIIRVDGLLVRLDVI